MSPYDTADEPDFFPFLDPTDRPALILIVGASAGPGLALAHKHARHGNDLVLVARRKKALEYLKAELEERYGTRVHTFASNLSSPSAARTLFEDVKGADLDVDLVINNADSCQSGTTSLCGAIEDPTAELGTTLSALVCLTALFADDMAKRDGGSILNIGSSAAPWNDPSSSDAVGVFMTKFSRNVDRDLRSKGVRARIKNRVSQNPFKLKVGPCGSDDKKMGNLKLRPSKYAGMNPGMRRKMGRFPHPIST